jgi:hypothetical protein
MKNIKYGHVTFYVAILIIISTSSAFAGTDGQELSGAYDKLVGIVGGVGGKIVALVSGALGLVGCAVKFNPTAILSFLGVSIGVGSVSFIVDSTVTALLNF